MTVKRAPDSRADFVVLPGDPPTVVLLSQRVPENGPEHVFLAFGRCMEPAIVPGDRFRVEEIRGPVRPGWIVVFPWQGRLLAHRVVRVQGDRFWASGDRADALNGPVRSGDALGRVVEVLRAGRWRPPEGPWGAARGLVVGRARRWLGRRFPGLRQRLQEALDEQRPLWEWLEKALLQTVSIHTESDASAVLGAVASDCGALSVEAVRSLEEHLEEGGIRVLVARSHRLGRIGSVILRISAGGDDRPEGHLSVPRAHFWIAGAGIKRLLLSGAEASGRESGLGRLVVRIEAEDRESLRLLGGLRRWRCTSASSCGQPAAFELLL